MSETTRDKLLGAIVLQNHEIMTLLTVLIDVTVNLKSPEEIKDMTNRMDQALESWREWKKGLIKNTHLFKFREEDNE